MAREMLTEEFKLTATDAQMAEYAEGGVVLGVRAREENLETVTDVLELHGGEPLVDVPEARTRRPDYAN